MQKMDAFCIKHELEWKTEIINMQAVKFNRYLWTRNTNSLFQRSFWKFCFCQSTLSISWQNSIAFGKPITMWLDVVTLTVRGDQHEKKNELKTSFVWSTTWPKSHTFVMCHRMSRADLINGSEYKIENQTLKSSLFSVPR